MKIPDERRASIRQSDGAMKGTPYLDRRRKKKRKTYRRIGPVPQWCRCGSARVLNWGGRSAEVRKGRSVRPRLLYPLRTRPLASSAVYETHGWADGRIASAVRDVVADVHGLEDDGGISILHRQSANHLGEARGRLIGRRCEAVDGFVARKLDQREVEVVIERLGPDVPQPPGRVLLRIAAGDHRDQPRIVGGEPVLQRRNSRAIWEPALRSRHLPRVVILRGAFPVQSFPAVW